MISPVAGFTLVVPCNGGTVTETDAGFKGTGELFPVLSLERVCNVTAVFNWVVALSIFATGLFVYSVGCVTVITRGTLGQLGTIIPGGHIGTVKRNTPATAEVNV